MYIVYEVHINYVFFACFIGSDEINEPYTCCFLSVTLLLLLVKMFIYHFAYRLHYLQRDLRHVISHPMCSILFGVHDG
jgi:hypothetical protein